MAARKKRQNSFESASRKLARHREHANILNIIPTFRTSDVDQFRDRALDLFGATRATVSKPDGFAVWGQFAQLSRITFAVGGSSSGFALTYPEADFARIQFSKRGRGSCTVANSTSLIEEGLACVTSPGQAARMDYGEEHERLTIRFPKAALHQKLFAILGAQPKAPLEFRPEVRLNAPRARGLVDLVSFLESRLDPALLSPIVMAEIEQGIITAFLLASQNKYSEQLEQDNPRVTTPNQVRLVEEFIEANWNKPIAIEDLVAITNVSARSLFRSFKIARGYSPIAFAKGMRLKHAKEMLTIGSPSTSVTGVAFVCGFSNLGHFAHDYLRAFGELPSKTLARSRSHF